MEKEISIQDFVIETPLARVFIDGVSKGFHNEYTVRNIQLACKNGKIDYNSVKFVFDGEEVFVNSNGKLSSNFPKGFYDMSYTLAFKLLD